MIDEVDQRPIEKGMGNPPMMEELEEAIRKAKNNNATGESGIPAEAIKALAAVSKEYLHAMLERYWQDEDLNYDQWNTAILKVIFKGKGDKKDLRTPELQGGSTSRCLRPATEQHHSHTTE